MIGKALTLTLALGTNYSPSVNIEDKINLEGQELVESTLQSKTFSSVTFGKAVFLVESKGEIYQSSKLKHMVGDAYGWAFKINSALPAVMLREVLILPEPSSSWSVSEDTEITEVGKIAITSKLFPINDGVVYNYWTISEGDPRGEYKIEIYYKDILIYSFVFVVE